MNKKLAAEKVSAAAYIKQATSTTTIWSNINTTINSTYSATIKSNSSSNF